MNAKATVPRLTELLELEYLQELQDSFALATGATTVILDPEGNRITRPSNWGGLCAMFYDLPESSNKCRAENRAVVQRGGVLGHPVIEKCPHGVTMASVPIIVDGTVLGGWLFGQMKADDPPRETLLEAAEKTGLDLERVEEAYAALPRMRREDFERFFGLVQTLTASIVELAGKNLELVRRDKELRGKAEQMEVRDRMLTQFVQSSSTAMHISDYYTGEIFMVNPAMCRITGLRVEEIIGRKCWEILGDCENGFCEICPRELLLDEKDRPDGPRKKEMFIPSLDKWLHCTHQVINWSRDSKAHMVSLEDVTQEHIMRDQLERMAFYHGRSGLFNGHKMELDYENDLMSGLASLMICFDLSSLRLFSDAYGRDAGDEMLRVIVHWLEQEDFGNRRIYHLGGHEFCLLLSDASPAEAVRVAECISARFEKPWMVHMGGREISCICGGSVSILHIPETPLSYRDLLALISRTLTMAGTSKGIFVYDEEMDRKNREHIELVLSLKDCVNQGMQGFSLEYQPIVDLSTGTWRGIEALCRWNRPGKGPVSPLVFIPEAESQGLINVLGNWVLDTAVGLTMELGLCNLEGFFLSVNISPIQMMDEAFADTVKAVLDRHAYPGAKLNLEVTESTKMTFNNFTRSMIDKLRGMGVRMALDDFGTGYSSFNNLKHIPVDFLKTEREFLLGIEDDSYMQYFLFTMAEIAHAHDMKLIAEGVETAEQLKIVKNNGADYVQGYFFSRPVTSDQLALHTERFMSPDRSFVPRTVEAVNLRQWLSGKNAYELTPALFMLMNRCMQIMLTETNVEQAFSKVFHIVGEHFGVSRAFAFVQTGPELFSNLYEWCAKGVLPQKHLLQGIHIANNTPSLMEAFRNEGMLVASELNKLPRDMYTALKGQDLTAVALLPMWDGKDFAGFVGFDHVAYHAWLPEEIVMLWNLSMLVAGAVKREQLRTEVVEKGAILDTVLQNSGLNAYVTDAETDEILWVNDTMMESFGLGPEVMGKKCYEVLTGSRERCAQCEIMAREGFGDGKPYFEVRHEDSGRDYRIYMLPIQWVGNKKAFIHYSMDLSEQKSTQKQLEYLASTDMLTGASNRSTAVGRMQNLLAEASRTGSSLAVCFVNVDNLRHINREYGYDMGDQALFHTVQAIKLCTRNIDVIGRLSGDSFIVIMPGCLREMAETRMAQANKGLSRVRLLEDGSVVSFSFGAADNTELPFTETAAYYSELLTLAETRMEEGRSVWLLRVESEDDMSAGSGGHGSGRSDHVLQD